MPMNSMHDLLVHELRDLSGAEQQLVKALPSLTSAANSEVLAQALRDHSEETEQHIARLEECLTLLGGETSPVKCKGMEGLLREAEDMIAEDGNVLVRDAGLIGAAQRVEHYEIAAYGTAVQLATVLGEMSVAALLRRSLDEEKGANAKLTEIAERDVNAQALLSSAVA